MHQCCMTHCRRKFVDVARGGKTDIVLEYMKKLYDVEGDLKEQKATAEKILKTRQKISKPVLRKCLNTSRAFSQKQAQSLPRR